MNSPRLIPKSFLMILFNNPGPMTSPEWQGIVVLLPSGCLRITWLPTVLIRIKPNFSIIFINSLPVILGSFVKNYTSTCWTPTNCSKTTGSSMLARYT